MKELHTEIEIAAPPAQVWRALTDVAAYPAWNPLITELRGSLVAGERLRVKLRQLGRTITIKPHIVRLEPERVLSWRGSLPLGLFTGEHSFEVHPLAGGRTRFHQWEKFTGLLIPLMSRMLDGSTRRGFEDMNRALKARAESLA